MSDPKSPSMRRRPSLGAKSASRTFTLTDAEYDQITIQAQGAGMSRTQYLVALVKADVAKRAKAARV